MCALASDFSGVKLDEETEPNKRLDQILDERGVTGDFRSLLTEHFVNNKPTIWKNLDNLNRVLSELDFNTDEKELSTAFWVNLVEPWELALDATSILDPEELTNTSRQLSANFQLALEIEEKYYSASPVELFKSNIGQKLSLNFGYFALLMYGKEYLYTEQYFDDSALAEPEYNQRLENHLRILNNYLFPKEFALGADHVSSNLDSLYAFSAATPCINSNQVPKRNELPFLSGLRFLEVWIKSDAKSGRISPSNDKFIWEIKGWISELESELRKKNDLKVSSDPSIKYDAGITHLYNFTNDIDLIFLGSANLPIESNASIESWASQIDNLGDYYRSAVSIGEKIDPDIFLIHKKRRLETVASGLSSEKLNLWIDWSVSQDIEKMKDRKLGIIYSRFERTSKWFCTQYASICKWCFEKQIAKHDSKTRLQILNKRIPILPEPHLTETDQWWSGLLKELVEEDDFPRDLIPNWTAAAIDKSLSHEELLPYFDKGIGILRNSASTDWDAEKDLLLKKLIEALTVTHPEKALKHRLLILRAINVPVTDSTLSLYRSPESAHTVEWYRPLRDIGQAWVSHSARSKPFTSNESYDQAYAEHLLPFNLQVAEFCLTRLRLRKKEKAVGGKYESLQVVESSSIWREAYIKVLQELGLDLNGRVHKTLHFIKSADPDTNVRNSAKECYKAVRKNNGKATAIELRRSLVAADWWLHLCQRQHLNEDIQRDEAIQTRRRLMRNP